MTPKIFKLYLDLFLQDVMSLAEGDRAQQFLMDFECIREQIECCITIVCGRYEIDHEIVEVQALETLRAVMCDEPPTFSPNVLTATMVGFAMSLSNIVPSQVYERGFSIHDWFMTHCSDPVMTRDEVAESLKDGENTVLPEALMEQLKSEIKVLLYGITSGQDVSTDLTLLEGGKGNDK